MLSVNKIKVCHVTTRFDVGGMENGIVNLCNGLDRTLFEPVICCINGAGEMTQRLKTDICFDNLNFKEGKSFSLFLKMRTYFKRRQPTIVHTHGWGGGSLYAIVGAFLARTPVIINGEHGLFYDKKHQVILQRIISRICTTNLAVSESLKYQVVDTLGISAERIQVIENGVDTDLFSGDHDTDALRIELREKFGITIQEDTFIAGCIGSLKPVKNQQMLLDALVKLKQSRPLNKLKVLFVGVGNDLHALKSFVIENNLADDVAFLGNRHDIPQLLSLMDILVSTSISEGLSNVFLEAMSSGIPVISSNHFGASQIIKHAQNGFLIKPGDIDALSCRIEQLMLDKQLCKKMGTCARNIILQEYSMEKMISSYEQLYLKNLH
jgi:sugar transferase (PEP-CTERM/EpsH1 system associated)